MESQEESSSSLQKSIYTNETDSENDSNDIPSITNILTGPKKKRNRNGKKDVYQVMVKKMEKTKNVKQNTSMTIQHQI
ncbi:28244_t:CDS:2 [Dentiscutata erythropus]|uniref:28244_t:CDS:1 n=1 Tax=Dentiscutata erythropus TaxID=1348616 RepID=A0A9N9C8P7_9GLOM|nr:28244_t:CDS:2 [Dentiscutata erythropus]